MARPKADTEAMNLRLPRDILDALDDMRREEKDVPNRQEMIRRILVKAIEARGQN
jgi:metal-responsive CopG/Arc/MetJ family transcriptional regulator